LSYARASHRTHTRPVHMIAYERDAATSISACSS